MYVPPKEEDLPPINKAWRLRTELGEAIERQQWKKAHNLAKELTRQVDICIAYDSRNLESLYCIGTMWYQMAPEKAQAMINRFNEKLKKAKGKLSK